MSAYSRRSSKDFDKPSALDEDIDGEPLVCPSGHCKAALSSAENVDDIDGEPLVLTKKRIGTVLTPSRQEKDDLDGEPLHLPSKHRVSRKHTASQVVHITSHSKKNAAVDSVEDIDGEPLEFSAEVLKEPILSTSETQSSKKHAVLAALTRINSSIEVSADNGNIVRQEEVSTSESTSTSTSASVKQMEEYLESLRQRERAAGRDSERRAGERDPPPVSRKRSRWGGGHGGRNEPKRHHVGDFVPEEELRRLDQGGEAGSYEHKTLDSSNVGHQLLSKMGWTEGSGLGRDGSGRVAPVAAGSAFGSSVGIGAAKPWEIDDGDDEYTKYRKRMMIGYKNRPNPF